MNIHDKSWLYYSVSDTPAGRELWNTFEDFGLRQLVSAPRHVNGNLFHLVLLRKPMYSCFPGLRITMASLLRRILTSHVKVKSSEQCGIGSGRSGMRSEVNCADKIGLSWSKIQLMMQHRNGPRLFLVLLTAISLQLKLPTPSLPTLGQPTRQGRHDGKIRRG